MKKTAIIILNLGGPSSLEEVKTFLFNLFYDKAIIRLPNPVRWIIAKIISSIRAEKAKEIYSLMGGKSPILEETEKQKKSLEKAIGNKSCKVFISMRYSEPNGEKTSKEVMEYNPEEIILLPLYPQFSTTTTESSIKNLKAELIKCQFKGDIKSICCYSDNDDFIKSHVKKIIETIKKLKSKHYRILFSAHSLPEKIIKDGDPYQWQIENTVKKIVENLDIKDLDYKITYQSKVTPVKWLEPSTEKEIEIAVKTQKALVIVPIAFVSEHSETLVELDIEYKSIADKYKIEYLRVPALGTDKDFISALANIVKEKSLEKKNLVSSDKKSRICPREFCKCICEI
jgi:ferrochelatase